MKLPVGRSVRQTSKWTFATRSTVVRYGRLNVKTRRNETTLNTASRCSVPESIAAIRALSGTSSTVADHGGNGSVAGSPV
jgi:hypothetical protein